MLSLARDVLGLLAVRLSWLHVVRRPVTTPGIEVAGFAR